jgi:hypothetical protein
LLTIKDRREQSVKLVTLSSAFDRLVDARRPVLDDSIERV